MGCIGRTFVGWLGAFVGQLLFGNWGPMLSRYIWILQVLLSYYFGIVIVRNEEF